MRRRTVTPTTLTSVGRSRRAREGDESLCCV